MGGTPSNHLQFNYKLLNKEIKQGAHYSRASIHQSMLFSHKADTVMSKPAQFSHEAPSPNQPPLPPCSLLDGVVIFPDGSVIWTPEGFSQPSVSAFSPEASTLPPESTATASRLPPVQPCYILLSGSVVAGRFWATSLGVAIALIVLFPIAYVLPLWAYEWRLETSPPSANTCSQD